MIFRKCEKKKRKQIHLQAVAPWMFVMLCSLFKILVVIDFEICVRVVAEITHIHCTEFLEEVFFQRI